jgi:hypothetical protein
MAFMQQEITGRQTWVTIDGDNGSVSIPYSVLTMDAANVVTETSFDLSEITLNEALGKYYDGRVTESHLHEGFGARMSAPGYMDCTEWAVFDTEAEAKSYLDEDNLFYEDETVG